MKPFITPKTSLTGKKLLEFQCEGIEAKALGAFFEGRSIVAYAMPASHTLHSVWQFDLILDNGKRVEFSSACTQVFEWQEAGSLNLQVFGGICDDTDDPLLQVTRLSISCPRIVSIAKLTYEDTDFSSECGLALFCGNGEEILVAVGVAPGSVSVSAPFGRNSFEPEFPIAACKREPLELS